MFTLAAAIVFDVMTSIRRMIFAHKKGWLPPFQRRQNLDSHISDFRAVTDNRTIDLRRAVGLELINASVNAARRGSARLIGEIGRAKSMRAHYW